MADVDTEVVVQDAQPGFTPEPVPDNIAEIELTGLNPDEESTDSQQAESEQEETTDDNAEETQETADDGQSETDSNSEEEASEPTEDKAAPTADEQKPEELTGKERRLAEKAQRDYVNEQRQQIREYQQTNDMENVEERMKVLEAQQYVDTVERNRTAAITDYTRATSEIPFFKQNTPQAQAALSTAIEQFNSAYAVTDPETGEYLGAQDRQGNNISLFNYLANEAARFEQVIGTSVQEARQEAQREAQKAEVKMRAKVVNPSNPGKVTSSGDELDDLLDKIGDVPLN